MTLFDYLNSHGGVAWTWTCMAFVLAMLAIAARGGRKP